MTLTLAFIRHGKTAPPPDNSDDADRKRILTDAGKNICQRARGSYFDKLGVSLCVSSPAGRCLETCSILCDGKNIPVVQVPYFYEGTREKACSEPFDRIGYGSLQRYKEEEATGAAYIDYAKRAMEELQNVLSERDVTKTDGTIAVFGHAVHLAAMAFLYANTLELSDLEKKKILDLNQSEVECILVSQAGVSILPP
eukprot:Rmarinus@m.23357